MARTSLICEQSPAVPAINREMVWKQVHAILEETGDSPPQMAPEDADYIDMLIEAAVSRLDGHNGLLNRALITQQWRMTFDRFDSEIRIPLGRCQSVDEISYVQKSGDSATMDPANYRVRNIGSDNARVLPAVGQSWPDTIADPEAVTVTFTAGFGDAPEDIPGSIRLALLEMVALAYAYRESAAIGGSFSVLPFSATRAVLDWVIWSP